MKSSTGDAARNALRKKTEELARHGHLPSEMTALVTAVAGLQLDALERARACAAPDAEGAAGDAASAMRAALAKAQSVPADRHAQGEPLLALRQFPIDTALAAALAADVLRALAEHAPSLAAPAARMEERFAADPSLLEKACRTLLEEAEQSADGAKLSIFAEWAKEYPDAPDLLRFVVKSALTPSVAACAELAGARHDGKTVWAHGHCPVCGSLPYMGRLDGAEGTRLHTCSFCFFEYRVPRIGCPFCLVQAHDGSEYLESEDEPGYLLDVCKECGRYIKLADFRKYDRAWFAALDDLASLTLDLYARQMGYERPTPSAWGF